MDAILTTPESTQKAQGAIVDEIIFSWHIVVSNFLKVLLCIMWRAHERWETGQYLEESLSVCNEMVRGLVGGTSPLRCHLLPIFYTSVFFYACPREGFSHIYLVQMAELDTQN